MYHQRGVAARFRSPHEGMDADVTFAKQQVDLNWPQIYPRVQGSFQSDKKKWKRLYIFTFPIIVLLFVGTFVYLSYLKYRSYQMLK